jgi:hypothetical protein
MLHRTALLVGFLCLGCTSASAEPQSAVVEPVRLDTPPVVDGFLDDDAWAGIEPITGFIQQDPAEGEPASERTEVRVAYDSRHLYFAVRAFDSAPDKLIANGFGRDSPLYLDDSFIIVIDANDDNRTAFMFESNPNGARTDIQLTETGIFNVDHDPIWTVRANVDELGYTLEFEIPLFVLRFKPAGEVSMGLLMRRLIRHKNEEVYWPFLSRDYGIEHVSQYGSMTGLKGLERGVDLEVKPAVIAGRFETPADTDHTGDVSLDVKWGVTPNLTADFTANTDFAHVESDDLRFNLTRFSLFVPEKRDFFLESEDLFQFGPQTAQAFFSRRIGIRDEQEIPIVGGARLYGLAGDTNLAFLSMRTDDTGDLEGESFSVARVKHNLLDRSYVGAIVTDRRGADLEEDTTFGLDFGHVFGVNSSLFGAAAKSDRPGIEDGEWFYHGSAGYDTDKLSGSITYMDVGENYDPGIGFVPRRDQRLLALGGSWKPRPSIDAVRQLSFGTDYTRIENHAGILESEEAFLRLTANFESADMMQFALVDTFEHVPAPFEIAPGVVIPAGEYEFTQAGLFLGTFSGRKFYANAAYNAGSFYGGDYRNIRADFGVKISPRFHIDLRNMFNSIELPGGEFDADLHRLYASYSFSPKLTTRLAAQYAGLEDELVVDFRLRWIYAPGSEAWLVYDEGRRYDIPGSSLQDRSVVLKVVHNFHR